MAKRSDSRLLSLDALRGFDMVWIMGAEQLFAGLTALTGWAVWTPFATQMDHVPWHGFAFYDLIFPLFIFISGVGLGLSAKRLDSLPPSERRKRYISAFRRLALLALLGILYNHAWGKGIPLEADKIRFASVLARIGVAWFLSAMLVWHSTPKVQWTVAGSILLLYWILLTAIPVPGGAAGALTAEGTWNAWVDQHFLPGRFYAKVYDPEGLLSHLPAVVNALAGVFAGRWLKANAGRMGRTLAGLATAGLACLVLGWAWHPFFPVNKELWTSSFVLVSCGWSCLLLAAFHGLIDGLGLARPGRFFAVIGANAIVAYLGTALVDWRALSQKLFGHLLEAAPQACSPLLGTLAVLALQWMVLALLYRRKIFLRV